MDIHNAADVGDLSALQAYIKSGQDVNGVKDGWTPLRRAARGGHTQCVRELLLSGATVDLADKYGCTPLSWAASEGHSDCLRELLSSGATVDLADKYGWTPLMMAARYGQVTDCVRELLSRGAVVDLANKNGNTPLMVAAYGGNVEAVKELLSPGASLHCTNEEGDTALMVAERSRHSNPSTIQLLKQAIESHSRPQSVQIFPRAVVQPLVKVHVPLKAPTPTKVSVDTTKLQEATDELRRSALAVSDTQLGSTVKSVVSLMERMTAALRSSSLSELTVHTDSIRTEIASVLVVTRRVVEECTVQSISENIGANLSKMEALSHQLCLVAKAKLRHSLDQSDETAALVDLVENGANLLRAVDCLLRDIHTLSGVSASLQEQLKYVHKLNELLRDKKNTINLRYLKLYLIGLSGLGKTTFRKRLLGHLLNLASIPPQDRKRCSTFLAECNQVLAVSSDSKLILKASTDIDKEAQLIFAYLIGLKQVVNTAISETVGESADLNDDSEAQPTDEVDPSKKQRSKEAKPKTLETNVDTNEDSKAQPADASTKQVPQEGARKPAKPKSTKVDKIIENLRDIVKRGNYMEQLVGTVLLNIIDIGGQPGFVEMLPFLSKGAGMFLAFFPLDKDLDELYEVSYERDQDKITPYKAKYTIRETLSQILSAISHHVTVDSDLDSEIADKVKNFGDLQAVVSLVGTYQDKLEIQAKAEVVQARLKGDYPSLDENTLGAAIQLILEVQQEVESEQKVEEIFSELEAVVGKQLELDSFSKDLVKHVEQKAKRKEKQQKPKTPQEDTELQSKMEVLEKTLPPKIKNKLKRSTAKTVQLSLQMKQCNETLSKLASAVVQQLSTDSTIQAETEKRLQTKLQEKHESLATITSNFGDVINHPDDKHFFSVDNFSGTDADIDPIREHLQTVFDSFFEDAELPIRPVQLLFGVILRKEFEIATMDECIQIGKALQMDEDEVKFTIWYLHQCVGTLLYYPDIKDKDSYFKNRVICSPNVVFNSISLLIVECLLSLHSSDWTSRFTTAEIKKWQELGQFSIATIKRCCSKSNKAKVKEGELIPVDKLVKLLEHVSLIAPIFGQGPQPPVYFMPAILECASKEELSNAPAVDSDTPSPIKITFESGYVPIGVFCAMISKLVSEGQKRILGLKWNLRESRVMRNFVSFEVDSAKHHITLVAHANCYEIRLTRREDCDMHDLCSSVLTTVLYVMSGISKKIEPIIAFDCQCPNHQKAEKVCLCKLANFFRCEHGRVDSLPPHQECWFAKEIELDEEAVLEALPFADPDPSLSFRWTRKGKKVAGGSDSELTVDKVSKDNCDGFYTCEISNKQLCFKVHHCLKSISISLAERIDMEHPLLNNQIETKEFVILADYFDSVRKYPVALGLTASQQADVRLLQVSDDTQTAMMECLSLWQRSNGSAATYRALVKLLLRMRKYDIANKVFKHCQENGKLT